MVPLYNIRVRRDAHTITPVTVPEYELLLLQELFGAENVQNADGRSIDEQGIGAVVGQYNAGDEYERFCAKYGFDLVESVYGKKSAKTLEKAVAESSTKTEPPKTPKAKPPKTEPPKTENTEPAAE